MISINATAQTEVMAWGNITGIRVDGQLMEFETSYTVANPEWTIMNSTGRERQRPKYNRDGNKQIVSTKIGSIGIDQVVEDMEIGSAKAGITITAGSDTTLAGVFYTIYLSDNKYNNGNIKFVSPSSGLKTTIPVNTITGTSKNYPLTGTAKGINAEANGIKVELNFDATLSVQVRRSWDDDGIQIFISLAGQKLKKGSTVKRNISIKTSGEIDHSPVEIRVDSRNPGRKFDGFGGNFRLQNPATDPQVIDYCLNNMRVAWSRVEMPWGFWQPEENINPIDDANKGNLNQRVDAAMKMAQRLSAMGIPVIVSAWSAPKWAIIGDPMDAFKNRSKGIYGYQLNPDKTEKIYKSLADYIEYLKNNYGVEASMFSFNESDLGINVRHTGKEHAEFIKGFGEYLSKRGLATRLLLGDNSDATTFDFVIPSLNDTQTHKYIGAVSFHSWRGCTDETLKKWAAAARQLNVPLLVAEGSTDAAAWNYPEIFSEESFAFYEINLYTRILSICQPASILQWQLTADYSVLTGSGIFGTQGPLTPTQRFWNLKQLASTPVGAFSFTSIANKKTINTAAFGNKASGEYAIHIVNNGAECKAVISGFPKNVSTFEIYVTDKTRKMEKTGTVTASNGKLEFNLSKAGFTTLIGK
jgi:O-glycosyl hydrolase